MNLHYYLRKECEATSCLGRKEHKAIYTAFTTNTSKHKLHLDSMFYSDVFLKKLGTSKRALVKAVDKSGVFYFRDEYSYTDGICKALCHNNLSRDILVERATDKKIPEILDFVYENRPPIDFDSVVDYMLTSNNTHHISESAKFLLQACETDLTKASYERKSGRLFATGGYSLQRMQTWLREKALTGWYNYDFKSCHVAILNTLGDFPTFLYYYENTDVVRKELAIEFGVGEKEIKLSLLSLIYGAKANSFGALNSYLGNNTKNFLVHPFVEGFISDCKKAQPILLQEADKMGIKGKTKSSVCASVLMTYEGRMLDIATKDVLESVLMFDGWMTTEKCDVKSAEKRIVDSTGIPIQITEEVV